MPKGILRERPDTPFTQQTKSGPKMSQVTPSGAQMCPNRGGKPYNTPMRGAADEKADKNGRLLLPSCLNILPEDLLFEQNPGSKPQNRAQNGPDRTKRCPAGPNRLQVLQHTNVETGRRVNRQNRVAPTGRKQAYTRHARPTEGASLT